MTDCTDQVALHELVDAATRTFERGQLERATSICVSGLSNHPDHPVFIYLIDLIHHIQKGVRETTDYLTEYIAKHPDFVLAFIHLGAVYRKIRLEDDAIQSFQKAVQLAPEDKKTVVHFLSCIIDANSLNTHAALETTLLLILENRTVHPDKILAAAMTVWQKDPSIRNLLAIANRRDRVALSEKIEDGTLITVLTRPLFLGLLKDAVFVSADWEWLLSALRGIGLHNSRHESLLGNDTDAATALFCAIANQCFLNEHIYWASSEEKTQASILAANLSTDIDESRTLNPQLIILFACYYPLHSLDHAERLETDGHFPIASDIETLIKRQVTEPRKEKVLEKLIPTVGNITDPTSKIVRSQYEENPYPRWLYLEQQKSESLWRSIKDVVPEADIDDLYHISQPMVLVAGCGTGSHPISLALNYKDCRITAIDISRTSLAYAKRKTEEINLRQISYIQTDILNVTELGLTFDFIACGGVLHHMADPVEGWRQLTRCLRPNGIMEIALYSDIARRQISEARQLISRFNYETSPDGIRQFRRDLMEGSFRRDKIGPSLERLLEAQDFFTLSMARDLAFHTTEHRFNLPEIKIVTEKLDLRFIGFKFENQNRLNEYRTRFKNDPLAIDLKNWNLFELEHPDTFSGCYQFFVQKK